MLRDFNGGIQVIGSEKSGDTYRLRDFMEKNHIWHTFLNTDVSEQAQQLLESFSLGEEDLPILINITGEIVKNPTIAEVARQTGVLTEFGDEVYDVLVVGAGPSGLAASVYAASEGLSVVTIDGNAPGGQAGKSSKIENYLGFPTGISGNELANKAYVQAQKFGCTLSIPQKAEKVEYHGDYFSLCVSNGRNINAKTIIAATGADYRRLPLENIERYEGSGVFYSATAMNATACKNEHAGVVGGGNSAGQAALFLAEHAYMVHVIIRGDDLGAKMSDYLVRRIYTTPNIIVHTNSSVTVLKLNTYILRKEIQDDYKSFVGNKVMSVNKQKKALQAFCKLNSWTFNPTAIVGSDGTIKKPYTDANGKRQILEHYYIATVAVTPQPENVDVISDGTVNGNPDNDLPF